MAREYRISVGDPDCPPPTICNPRSDLPSKSEGLDRLPSKFCATPAGSSGFSLCSGGVAPGCPLLPFQGNEIQDPEGGTGEKTGLEHFSLSCSRQPSREKQVLRFAQDDRVRVTGL